MNIVVLGSGGWGTAAAMLLSDNGHTVALWSHDPKKAELLDKTRENPLLKGVRIPERISGAPKCGDGCLRVAVVCTALCCA